MQNTVDYGRMSLFLTTLDDAIYQDVILQGVSRTFALTIPQLPEPLAQVVGNAYLLCRIADTIEDDASLSAEQKRQFSNSFIQVVAAKGSAQAFSESLFPLLSTETSDAEYSLIANTPAVIRITHHFNQRQRAAIERCVSIMTRGMARYQNLAAPDRVKDLSDLGQYCYHVAGVVGEMLTELFCDYSAAADSHHDELMELAVSFGQALQMTNILKDIWEDHRRSACWLPQTVFAKYGVDITKEMFIANNGGFQQGLAELIGIAHTHLVNALHYTLLLPSNEKGLRVFCAWALGMAILTLGKINKNRCFTAGDQVKISRFSVRLTALLTRTFAANNSALRLLFYLASRNLPSIPIRERLAKTADK